jgi:acyl-CoA-binding protein
MAEEFENAAKKVQSLTKRPGNDELLKLYALYKQATDGDATGARPGMFDLKGRAKYDAWAGMKGKTKEAAKNEYIVFAEGLVKKYA